MAQQEFDQEYIDGLIEYHKKVAQQKAERFRELTHGKQGIERIMGQVYYEVEQSYEMHFKPMPLRALSQRYNRQIKPYYDSFQGFLNELLATGQYIVLETPKYRTRYIGLTKQMAQHGVGADTPEYEQYIRDLEQMD